MLKNMRIIFPKVIWTFFCFFLMFFAPIASTGHAEQKPIHIKISTYVPPVHYHAKLHAVYAKKMEELSGGRVIVEFYPGEALGKSREQWDIVREGIADISTNVSVIFYPALFPRSGFVELPFIAQNVSTCNEIIQELIRKKLITDEWEKSTGVKLLAAISTPPAQVFSNKKLEKAAHFEGLRVVGQGPVWTKTWKLLGAHAVGMGWPDIYLGLQRRTIDAAPGNWAASTAWKWQEVAKYPTNINIMGGFFNAVIMNRESWDKIPTDIQEKWTQLWNGFYKDLVREAEKLEKSAMQVFKGVGIDPIYFSDQELERMAQKLLPVWQDWIDRNDPSAVKEIYSTYVKLMKKFGQPIIMKIPGYY
jgi:TRAP-type C4-dicarboxylate transport system substrate-binding protein